VSSNLGQYGRIADASRDHAERLLEIKGTNLVPANAPALA